MSAHAHHCPDGVCLAEATARALTAARERERQLRRLLVASICGSPCLRRSCNEARAFMAAHPEEG